MYSDLPAVHGCAAIFHDCKSLKMKESENRAFRFPCSEKSRMDLFRASLNPYRNGTINSATMLMILINGLIAGPAVSL